MSAGSRLPSFTELEASLLVARDNGPGSSSSSGEVDGSREDLSHLEYSYAPYNTPRNSPLSNVPLNVPSPARTRTTTSPRGRSARGSENRRFSESFDPPSFDRKYIISTSPTKPGYVIARCPECSTDLNVPLEKPEYHWLRHTSSNKCTRRKNSRLAVAEANAAVRTHAASFPGKTARRFHPYRAPSPCDTGQAPQLSKGNSSSTPPVVASTSCALYGECTGIFVPWPPGTILRSFPLHLFEELRGSLGFHLASLREEGRELWVKSDRCIGVVESADDPACISCLRVLSSRSLHRIQASAARPWGVRSSHQFMNPEQSQVAMKHMVSRLATTRISLFRARGKISHLEHKIQEYVELLNAIAVSDVPRVNHLIHVALYRGASVSEVLDRIKAAAANIYHARSYTEIDVDLARLMRHLAGDKGSYILHKALGLPSSTTVKALSDPVTILASPAQSYDRSTASTNYMSSFPPRTRPVPLRRFRGHILGLDNIAVNPRVRLQRRTNTMIGLCREHVGVRDVTMSTWDNVYNMAQAVRGPDETTRCHIGSEGIVAAVCALDPLDYHGRAVFVGSTCKTGTADDFEEVVVVLSDEWEERCASEYGPMVAIATDGASYMRLACYRMLLKRHVEGDLRSLLAPLVGFNLMCGERDIIYCPDTKHLFKRIGTLLRNPEGMLVAGILINRVMLERMLLYLPEQTTASVEILLDPKDHQNVPRSIRLLLAIIRLSELDPTLTQMSPDECVAHHALRLLALVFKSITDAFINPDYSLSQHLTSLSVLSHLLYALFTQHGPGFMSNQLYGDLQSLAKAAFWIVARQQLLDDTQAIHLYQLGTDRLEELFAEVRTQTHDRNVDIAQLVERLGIAGDIIKILNKHPEWNRPQRRLSFTDSQGDIDHVNPSYFKGDMITGHVDLRAAWNHGFIAASRILYQMGIAFDIHTTLGKYGDNTDFMRPFGVYPGEFTGPDRSLAMEVVSAERKEEQGCSDGSLVDGAVADGVELRDLVDIDGDGNVVTAEQSLHDWLPVPKSAADSSDPRPIHKASILEWLFNSGLGTLSLDRLRRVRGFSQYAAEFANSFLGGGPGFPAASSSSDVADSDFVTPILKANDHVVVPIISSNTVALGLLKVTSLECGGKRVKSVSEDKLCDSGMKVVVCGQVRAMLPASDSSGSADIDSTHYDEDCQWLWTGEYSRFSPLKHADGSQAISEDGTKVAYIIRTPGQFVIPVDESTASTALLPSGSLRFSGISGDSSRRSTYAVNESCMLEIACAELYETLKTPAALVTLNRYGASTTFPYRYPASQAPRFVLEDATRALQAQPRSMKEKIGCFQCGEEIAKKELRGHVGKHILRALVGQAESELSEQINLESLPCGFCGRGGCTVELMRPKASSKPQAVSDCPRMHPFGVKVAQNPSQTTPSTNVPLHCALCEPDPRSKEQPVLWKYNMFQHIKMTHPRYWNAQTSRPQHLSGPFSNSLNASASELEWAAPSRQRPYPLMDPSVTSAHNSITASFESTGPSTHTNGGSDEREPASRPQKRIKLTR